MRFIKYLWYVIRHKSFVFVECCKLGLPWLGVSHDWSKFRPSEFFPYAEHFYGSTERRDNNGNYQAPPTDDAAFDAAWLHHQHRNKHHWQYWILTQDEDEEKLLPMPDKYRREMLADWHGAGKAITGKNNTISWYADNREKIRLHGDTRKWIDEQLFDSSTLEPQ